MLANAGAALTTARQAQAQTSVLTRTFTDTTPTSHTDSPPILQAPKLGPLLTSDDAQRLAAHDPRTRAAIAQYGGALKLGVRTTYGDDATWHVDYLQTSARGSDEKTVVEVDVSDTTGTVTGVWTGVQIAWTMARGVPGAFGADINRWFYWWPLVGMFALVMFDPRRLCSWHNLDIIAVLSFCVSKACFDNAAINWSVPLAVPPLVYLLVRASTRFLRDKPSAVKPARRIRERGFPTSALILVAVAAAAMRYVVDGLGSNVIDVGYAGVYGAHDILHHVIPYGHMPSGNANGDTYGPLNYILYVPSLLIFGRTTDWLSGLPSAHAVAITSDVLCALALAVLGLRWFSRRGAAMLVCGWMCYPFTAYALCNNTNDLIVTAFILWALVCIDRPAWRGTLIAAATAVKFVPIVALAPMLRAGRRRGAGALIAIVSAAAVVLALNVGFILLYPHGWQRFVHATWHFQFNRNSPFSPWGYYHARLAQRITQIVFGLAILAMIFVPRKRSALQITAGVAAALLALEVTLQHWFYLYIPWFFGAYLIVMVAHREPRKVR